MDKSKEIVKIMYFLLGYARVLQEKCRKFTLSNKLNKSSLKKNDYNKVMRATYYWNFHL